MSATDELRALLDERGVEWRRTPHYSSESLDNETVFAGDGIEWYANDHLNGRLGLRALRYEVTPEQAIDATLGRGTCCFEQIPEALYDDIECSECGVALWGFQMDIAGEGCPTKPRYCPNCGRAVVE